MEFPHPDINRYAEDHTTPENKVQADLNRETHVKVLYPQMLSGHLQGRTLAMLAKMIQPRRILEIGTYTGYSAICMAEGLQEDGKIITLEVDPELKDFAEPWFEKAGIADKVDMRIGNALELIPEIDEELDMVFIDADKSNYTNYYKMVLPKLRKGGYILADNVLWSGQVLKPDVKDKEAKGLIEFANFAHNDSSVENLLLPIRDGIMVVRKL